MFAAALLVPSLAGATTYEPALGNPFDGYDLANSSWVRSGDGSAGHPFVISGWERNLTNGANGSELGSTAAYLTIRANHFFGDGVGPHTQCCRAMNVFELQNFTFEDNLVEKVRMTYAMFTGYHDARVTQDNVRILRNQILNNTDAGLSIANARNFTIAENLFVGTGGPPIALRSNTADIRVFHNTFINNSAQPIDGGGSENAWDDGYPSGGNYWSDYNGTDTCKGAAQDDCTGSDGIGDTPYVIDGDSKDRYPLMAPYTRTNHAPTVVLAFSPEAPAVNETVSFDASQTTDPDGAGAALEFRWDLDGDGSFEVDWSTTSTPTTTFAQTGNVTVHVEARDSAGAKANASAIVSVVEAAAPDPHPASVVANAPPAPRVGQEFQLETTVSDAEGVAKVQVIYRGVGSVSFTSQGMTAAGGGTYRATLPAQENAGSLEYYFLVTDMVGHQTRDPPTGAHNLPVLFPEIIGDPAPVPWWARAALSPGVLIPVALLVATLGVYALMRRRRQ